MRLEEIIIWRILLIPTSLKWELQGLLLANGFNTIATFVAHLTATSLLPYQIPRLNGRDSSVFSCPQAARTSSNSAEEASANTFDITVSKT